MKLSVSLWPICVGVIVIGGCADWPRSANLPEEKTVSPGSSDLGELFDITWTQLVESDFSGGDGNNNFSASIANYGAEPIALNQGRIISGSLSLSGWNKDVPRPQYALGEACLPLDLETAALDAGYYIGDLDFYAFTSSQEPETKTVLCGIAETEDESLGWDLLLFELNECDIAPPRLIIDGSAESVMGYGLGGLQGHWIYETEPGKQYAVLFAGYTKSPSSEEEADALSSTYRLGTALIQAPTSSQEVICPNLSVDTVEEEEE